MTLGGQLTGQGLQLIGGGEQFGQGQRVDVAGGQRVVRGAQPRERFLHDRPGHASNIRSTTDKTRRGVTTETTVTQGITPCAQPPALWMNQARDDEFV